MSLKLYKTPSLVQKAVSGIVWKIPTQKPKLYLTFDDGPTPEVTLWVLDLLKRYNAKATFFCLGKNIEKHPEIFERIKIEGHAIGNHSFDHPRGKVTTNGKYFENIEKADKLIESRLFRPPYGSLKISQYRELKKKYKIVLWDLLSYDFELDLDLEESIFNMKSKVENGSILVFHDSKKAFPQLKIILPRLLEDWYKAYTFVAINEDKL